jgi:hypothetical protein
MRSFLLILTAVLVLLLCAMAWQHFRYLDARRNAVQDAQPLLHSSDAFHVVTFVESGEAADLIGGVSRLARALVAAGGRLVYAGQAAFTAPSAQIGSYDWDAVLLVQYPSHQAYDTAVQQPGVGGALADFRATYSHGMERSPLVNLIIPQALLALRITDLVRGNWSPPALERMPEAEWNPERRDQLREAADRLRGLRKVNDAAVLVFNLTKAGTSQQQEADRAYGLRMLRRMAAGAHGPMHIGRAVVLEGDADFEQVVLVYYPGPGYFADLLESSFFQGIVGDKQLGDNQSVPTVPIRSLLTLSAD